MKRSLKEEEEEEAFYIRVPSPRPIGLIGWNCSWHCSQHPQQKVAIANVTSLCDPTRGQLALAFFNNMLQGEAGLKASNLNKSLFLQQCYQ